MGPQRQDDGTSQAADKKSTVPIFYLQFPVANFGVFVSNPGGGKPPWDPQAEAQGGPILVKPRVVLDGIDGVVRLFKGATIPIRTPRDLAAAIRRMGQRIVEVR